MSRGGGAAAAGAGGGGGDSNRVSIPSNVRKMIRNIKEITGNHSEEDIYAMLKECSMDPNETAQKLLVQDTFHEVKRKRDQKKENLNKEPEESRWKPGMQGRGTRGSRTTHSSRNTSHDNIAGGTNSASAKESGPNQGLDKGATISSLPTSSETKSNEANSAASSLIATATVPTAVVSADMIIMHDSPATASETRDQYLEQKPSNCSTSITSARSSGAYFLSPDPLLLSSQDSLHSNVVGTIKREVGIQHTGVAQISALSDYIKSTSGSSERGSANVQGKIPSKSRGNGKNQHLDSLQTTTSVSGGSAASRPSSNYNNRSQTIGQQKGPNKEWKPKSTTPNLTQGYEAAAASDAASVSVEPNVEMMRALNVLDSKDANVELQRKLEELHISDGQLVIIPNHLHVPEAEKLGFCFGSFDASYGIRTSLNITPENDQSASLSQTSDRNEEAVEEQFSSEGGLSSSNTPDYNDSKEETRPGGHQYLGAHTSPNYSFGFMPPAVGSQLTHVESSESQPRDVLRPPTFIVQQQFDPTSYYTQFYCSGADTDGRISPLHSAGAATKYSENFAMVSPLTSQSPQEGGSSLIFSTAAPTALVTQAACIMQSSMAVTQQPLSVFRPPASLHLPHYPSNYVPYGHYISPFYIHPPAIHQFLSNGAFPQQPQGTNVYPAPSTTAPKYSLPQYKSGTNTNNSTHVGIPGSYVPYGSSVANYNPSAVTPAGNSTLNEDLATSHFKENNVYASGQQSEGSGVWITSPGRDITSLQASSFYNLPRGQMAFPTAQPGHGTFTGIYHLAQPVNATTVHPLLQQSQRMAGAVDMAGPAASGYQQPQHSQINWPSNF